MFLSAGGVTNKNKILQTEETDLKCVAVINLTRHQNLEIELKIEAFTKCFGETSSLWRMS